MVVGDDAVTEEAHDAGEAIAEDGRADVADVHRLGDVRRTEVNDGGAPLRGRLKEQMFAARRGFERLGEHGNLEPKIQEARTGDFHRLAPLVHVEPGDHVGGELARIHFARLGERHERVALVIAEFGIGTRTDQNHGGVGVRQDRADGGLELQFNLFVRQHGNSQWRTAKFTFHVSRFMHGETIRRET